MKFSHIRIRDDQDAFLRSLPGSVTENIRQAIDDYIKKINASRFSSSSSKGGHNG